MFGLSNEDDPMERFQMYCYDTLNSYFNPEQYAQLMFVLKTIKTIICSCAVMALITMVFAGIALSYCVLQIPPIANFILLFAALLLLAYCEALHYGVIAVEKWDMEKYREQFPRAYKSWKLVDTPHKVKKFIVGRQFFVIFVVFLISQITSFPHVPKDFIGLPPGLILALLETGLPGVAIVLTFGQLVSQIFVEEFTLQFMNLYGVEFVIRLSLGAEWVGICHTSWGLFHSTARLLCSDVKRAKKIMNSQNDLTQLTDAEAAAPVDTRSPSQKIRGPDFESGLHKKEPLTWFDGIRYLWSTFATGCSIGIILYGISIKAYVLPTPVPAAYIIAILMLANLFFLEGLMIAVVATQYWDPELWKDVYPRAYKLHKLVNRPDYVKRFIIGRQFFTVLTNFLLGQIFTFANFENPGWDPILFYVVIKSGLVGVLTTLAFGQLMPELLAAEYPLRFMDLYYSYSVTYFSLAFDWIGVGHCGWAVYYTTRHVMCGSIKADAHGSPHEDTKQSIVQFDSPEVFVKSQSFKEGKPPPKKDFSPSGSPSSVSYTGVNAEEIDVIPGGNSAL